MEIRMFTVPDCGRCQAVKEFLKRRGLDYEEINVAGNFTGLREMIRLSGSRTVPVTAVGPEWCLPPIWRPGQRFWAGGNEKAAGLADGRFDIRLAC
jgi:glutaredoxin